MLLLNTEHVVNSVRGKKTTLLTLSFNTITVQALAVVEIGIIVWLLSFL